MSIGHLYLHTDTEQKEFLPLFEKSLQKELPPTLREVSHDLEPPPPASPTMDLFSSTLSHNSSNWPIALKKGIQSTCNSYPIYNFSSYHCLSPTILLFIFCLPLLFPKLFEKLDHSGNKS